MRALEFKDIPQFRPDFRVERLGSELVFLVGSRERYILADRRTAQIADLIDGVRTVEDILGTAGRGILEAEVLYVLTYLVERRYVTVASPEIAPAVAAFWHGVHVDAARAVETLGKTAVAVRSVGEGARTDAMLRALSHAGVGVDAAAEIQVVVVSDYLEPELEAINQRSLDQNAPWFLLKPIGAQPLIGPLFRPGQGPCWACLAFWMRNNRPVEELLRRRIGGPRPFALPDGSLEASVQLAVELGALVMARNLVATGSSSAMPWRPELLALDLESFQTTAHTVVRRPQCSACGRPDRMSTIGRRPIELLAVPKSPCTDGGHRQRTPREIYERYRHLVSPFTGPVTHVVPAPGRDTEIRAVYGSGYMICPRDQVPNTNVFDKVCAGKGRSAEQAKASALCEALERFSGVYQGDEARVPASRQELGAPAIAPTDLLNFSASQSQARERLNRDKAYRRDRIPEPLDDKTTIDWTHAWSLTHDERRYVPLTYCYSEAPIECGTIYCSPCGNGVAAGACLEEAILHGLLELVERDAASIWWYNRVSRPAIDIESFGDSYFDAVSDDYDRLGWKMWVLDLTHDIPIPSYVAIAHRSEDDHFSIGFGTHVEPRIAVQRALTELNQLFEPNSERVAPWDHERLRDREFLFPRSDLPKVAGSRLPRTDSADLRTEIQTCVRLFEERSLEIVAVDKTRPDIDLHVAQVIVPGLRHFWPRFGPGRLYDVPHSLGWVPRRFTEGELNSVPLLL